MTSLSEFYPMIRSVLGDNDPDVHLYEDETLANQMRVVLVTGRVDGFALSADKQGITPDLLFTATKPCAQLIYFTAKNFAVLRSRQSFRQRAFGFSKGEDKELMWSIYEEIAALEDEHVGSG